MFFILDLSLYLKLFYIYIYTVLDFMQIGFEWIWFATLSGRCFGARWLERQRLPANGASYRGFGPLRAYRLNPDLTSSLDRGFAQMAIKQCRWILLFPSRHLPTCFSRRFFFAFRSHTATMSKEHILRKHVSQECKRIDGRDPYRVPVFTFI